MTDPNELQAGPELAAAIAVEVMGYRLCDGVPWPCGKPYRYWMAPDGSTRDEKDWRPDFNIAAAWDVLEKLRVDGWWRMLEGDDDSWICRIQERGDPHNNPELISVYAEALGAPLAICRAALAAVRARKEAT